VIERDESSRTVGMPVPMSFLEAEPVPSGYASAFMFFPDPAVVSVDGVVVK
jgi:hypothetical protein